MRRRNSARTWPLPSLRSLRICSLAPSPDDRTSRRRPSLARRLLWPGSEQDSKVGSRDQIEPATIDKTMRARLIPAVPSRPRDFASDHLIYHLFMPLTGCIYPSRIDHDRYDQNRLVHVYDDLIIAAATDVTRLPIHWNWTVGLIYTDHYLLQIYSMASALRLVVHMSVPTNTSGTARPPRRPRNSLVQAQHSASMLSSLARHAVGSPRCMPLIRAYFCYRDSICFFSFLASH